MTDAIGKKGRPGCEDSILITVYSLDHTEGTVRIYRKNKRFEIVVVSWAGDTITPFFMLTGRHRKFSAAEKRARRVAQSWGRDG